LWWKDERPNRVSPWDDGWTEDIKRTGYYQDFLKCDLNHPELELELEDLYTKEDTEMLARLAKIRTSLWT